MTPATGHDLTHDADARALVTLYTERIRLTWQMARSDSPTVAMAADILAAARALDAACEVFRRRHYPRSGGVCVGLYAVMVATPAGRRRLRTVYDGYDEFSSPRDEVGAA